MALEPWKNIAYQQCAQQLMDSFQHYLSKDLIEPCGNKEQQAKSIYFSSRIVIAHDNKEEPRFIFANRAATDLWEVEHHSFIGMPSKQSAEQEHRKDRARMLNQAKEKGYILNYSGIRVSKQGKRFFIENAIIWNVLDNKKNIIGQAATFEDWKYI